MLAKAAYQSAVLLLTSRLREQARSHIPDSVFLEIARNKKAPIAGASLFSESAYMFG